MDKSLVPLMFTVLATFSLGIGYVVWSVWSSQRAIAWNVVNAALTLRQLSAEQQPRFQQGLAEALQAFGMTPEALAGAEPCVKFATYAEALRRQGIAPVEAARPFKRLSTPLLARSVASHIRVVRFHAEMRHAVTLSALD